MPAPRCQICRQPVSLDAPTFPFCSSRCRQIDLNRWLTEGYSVTTFLDPDEADEEVGPEPDYDDE